MNEMERERERERKRKSKKKLQNKQQKDLPGVSLRKKKEDGGALLNRENL